MIRVFFSYSHQDQAMRDLLETHLTSLKREGAIETWHDRCLIAGDEWAGQIDANLEKADVILLLISPYFIASDYCYDLEMKRALERHQANETRVIPVIIEHCDWKNTPFGMLQATPTDGKPVSQWPNHHEALNIVTNDIRMAVDALTQSDQTENKATVSESYETDGSERSYVEMPRSSNLRVKKEFNDRDRSLFLRAAFDYILNFFQNTLIELEKRSTEIATEFTPVDANTFTCGIYRSGNIMSRCKIWLSTDEHGFGDLGYSSDWSSVSTSWEDALSIDDDGFVLGLKPSGFSAYGNEKDEILTLEGGAEYFWERLIEPLQ